MEIEHVRLWRTATWTGIETVDFWDVKVPDNFHELSDSEKADYLFENADCEWDFDLQDMMDSGEWVNDND